MSKLLELQDKSPKPEAVETGPKTILIIPRVKKRLGSAIAKAVEDFLRKVVQATTGQSPEEIGFRWVRAQNAGMGLGFSGDIPSESKRRVIWLMTEEILASV